MAKQIIVIRENLRNVSVANFGVMSFGDTQLVPCESVKNLGVVLDSWLSFRSHIDSIVKTYNFHIHNLYMIKDFVNRKNLVTLVHSLIVSKVDYCSSLFIGLLNVILKKVQSVLNRAARLIFNLPPRVPTSSSLIELPLNPQVPNGVYKPPLVYCWMGFINTFPFPALHLSRNAAIVSESLKISDQHMAKRY